MLPRDIRVDVSGRGDVRECARTVIVTIFNMSLGVILFLGISIPRGKDEGRGGFLAASSNQHDGQTDK